MGLVRPILWLAIAAAAAAHALRAPERRAEAPLVGDARTIGEANRSPPAAEGFFRRGLVPYFNLSEFKKRFPWFLHKARDWIYNDGYAQLPTWSQWYIHVTVSWVIFMMLCLLVWMNMYPDDPDVDEMFADREKADPVQTLTEDHFGCFKTPRICFCACICPALRWADSVNMAGFMRVPVALGLFFICALVNGLTGTFCYIGIVTCCLILYYRHRLRVKLGVPAFTLRTCFVDFFFVFCCSFCAIAQEARVVRYAYQQGTLSLATGKRYGKSELPDRPFPRVSSGNISAGLVLPPPPEPAPLAAQRLVAEGRSVG